MLRQWELQPCRISTDFVVKQPRYCLSHHTYHTLLPPTGVPDGKSWNMEENQHQAPTGYAAVFWTLFWVLVSDSCNHLTRRPSSQTPSTRIYARPGRGEGHTAFFNLDSLPGDFAQNWSQWNMKATSRYHAEALFQHQNTRSVKHNMAESPCFFSCARLTLEFALGNEPSAILGQWACDSWCFAQQMMIQTHDQMVHTSCWIDVHSNMMTHLCIPQALACTCT